MLRQAALMLLAPPPMQVQSLVGRLLAEEQYGLAVYVAKRWELDARRIWEQWATALIACALSARGSNTASLGILCPKTLPRGSRVR